MNDLKGKKILITSGGTREYIDDVRVLTNISSGMLGAKMADACFEAGAKVYYVHARGAVMPRDINIVSVTSAQLATFEIVTVADLMYTIKHISNFYYGKIDAVIMAVAASDFTFKRDKRIKLKSNDSNAFIEYMRKTIAPNPKVILEIKKWCPDTYLVGFKFEVGLKHDKLIRVARKAMKKNKADLIIANDKTEIKKAKKHIAYLVTSKEEKMCKGKDVITENLVNHLCKVLKR